MTVTLSFLTDLYGILKSVYYTSASNPCILLVIQQLAFNTSMNACGMAFRVFIVSWSCRAVAIQLLRLVIHVASKDERCKPEACLRRWQCSSPSQKNGGFHGYVSGVICGTSLGLATLLQAALLKSVRKGAGGLPCHFHAVGLPP